MYDKRVNSGKKGECMKRYRKIITLILVFQVSLEAAPLIEGNIKSTLQSFDFPIFAHSFSSNNSEYRNNVFVVGARVPQSGNTFSIAAATVASTHFVPLTPEKVTLNYQANQTNPLYGAAINFIDHILTLPIVVPANASNQIFLFLNYSNLRNILLLVTDPLLDTQGNFSGGIVGLTAHAPYVDNLQKSTIAYAFKNNAGQFGAPGSGIGTLLVSPVEITKIVDDKEQKHSEFRFFAQSIVPIDTTTLSLAINDPIASIDNDAQGEPVALTISRSGALYTGLLVTGAAGVSDGARGVMLNNAQEIAPAAAVQTDSIIGGVGPSTQVSIHRLKTMLTTTSLDYLIVQGGVGDPLSTKAELFALPLVLETGALARKDALPQDIFSEFAPFHFKGRMFTQPAVVAGDLFSPTDRAARIGGVKDLPNDITDLFVVEDSIYVTTLAGDNQSAGIFYSRALFDAYGRIKDWTDWQRAGAQGSFFGLGIDARATAFWYLEGTDAQNIFAVRRTAWSQDITGLARTVNTFFNPENYGVQGVIDIPYTHAAFDQTIGNRLSVSIFTGNKKVMLVQSGADQDNLFGPAGVAISFVSTQGTLDAFTPTYDAIAVSGGELDQLGALVSSALAFDNAQGWFVFGGNGGIAVLAHEDGTGFTTPLQTKFNGLDAALRIISLNTVRDVKKVIAQENSIYFLTLQGLYRYELTAQTVAHPVAPVLLAGTDDVAGAQFFNDFLVSGSYAVLATSNGLWQVSSGSVQTASQPEELEWSLVSLHESPGAVTRLQAVSPTEFDTDFATRNGGNIIALAAYAGYHQARIYRFVVSDGSPLPTLQPFPDFFVYHKPSFYANIGNYRNGFFSDGGLYLVTESKYDHLRETRDVRQQSLPYMWALPGLSMDDRRFFALHAIVQQPLNNILSLHTIVRRSSEGSLMVAGDQGIRINE